MGGGQFRPTYRCVPPGVRMRHGIAGVHVLHGEGIHPLASLLVRGTAGELQKCKSRDASAQRSSLGTSGKFLSRRRVYVVVVVTGCATRWEDEHRRRMRNLRKRGITEIYARSPGGSVFPRNIGL